ncbi:MAG: DEAD/DEAH box helicase [Nitrososphaeraceae archaeon]|nr:DEAD/DEAH box helicase [Nitrososphaeraceae archaeon]
MIDNNSYSISNIKYVKHPLIRKNSIEYRSYQDHIVNSARYKNTMIILPTALGKTVISALICADIMYNYKKLKILIMAPTKPLVLQHMNSFLSFLQV